MGGAGGKRRTPACTSWSAVIKSHISAITTVTQPPESAAAFCRLPAGAGSDTDVASMSSGKVSEDGGGGPRKPSDYVTPNSTLATLASLTLPSSVEDACAKTSCRAGAPLLSPPEQSAATLIAATVRLHQARRDPAASRARQDAYPVSASAATATAAAASATCASAALLLAPPPRFWRRSSRQHLELGVAVATSPLRGVRLLWYRLPIQPAP